MTNRIIIAVLVLVIGYLIYRDFRPAPTIDPEISNQEDSIAIKRRQIDSLLLKGEQLRLRLESDSIKSIEAQKAFKMRLAALTQKLAEKRPEIEPLLDSMPKLAAFVLLQDSIIDVQAVRIDSLERQKARQWVDFNKLLDVEQDKFQASSEINLHLTEIAEHYSEENKKLKRQNRWLKIGVGSAFVAGLLLSR